MKKIEYCKCLNCGAILRVRLRDRKAGDISCPECGYTNELRDFRLKIWTEKVGTDE